MLQIGSPVYISSDGTMQECETKGGNKFLGIVTRIQEDIFEVVCDNNGTYAFLKSVIKQKPDIIEEKRVRKTRYEALEIY